MVLGVRSTSNGQPGVLQPIDPEGHLALAHVTPFVELLAKNFHGAEHGEEESDLRMLRSSEGADERHGRNAERHAQFVHIVAEATVGDGPWS